MAMSQSMAHGHRIKCLSTHRNHSGIAKAGTWTSTKVNGAQPYCPPTSSLRVRNPAPEWVSHRQQS